MLLRSSAPRIAVRPGRLCRRPGPADIPTSGSIDTHGRLGPNGPRGPMRWSAIAWIIVLSTACGGAAVQTGPCSGDARSCARGSAAEAPVAGPAQNTARPATPSACGDDDGSCSDREAPEAQPADIDRDVARAVALYQKACDGGEPRGCFRLAYLYSKGIGVAHDAARSVALYQKACDGNELRACTNLGWHLARGDGAAEDTV